MPGVRPATNSILGRFIAKAALYLGFAALIGRARQWFSRVRVRRRLDALCGTVLIGLGIRVAAQSR
jgi:threonine/homoserine/homoserine lactone efflux protein